MVQDSREHHQQVRKRLDPLPVVEHDRRTVRRCIQVNRATQLGGIMVVPDRMVRTLVDHPPTIFDKQIKVQRWKIRRKERPRNMPPDRKRQLA